MATRAKSPHPAFRTFGPAFIRAVFTEAFMARTLSALIKPDPPIEIHEELQFAGITIPTATGTARPSLGRPNLVTADDPCEVIFEVPLHLDLALNLVGFDPYHGPADLRLILTIQAYEPAFLHVAVGRVQAEGITFTGPVFDWFAAALGTLIGGSLVGVAIGKFAADFINGQIRAQIADQIKKRIRESEADRWIDLATMVQESLSAEGEIRPTANAAGFAPVVGPDQQLSGQLSSGNAHYFDLLLRPGEQVVLYVYARVLGARHYNDSGATLSVALLGPKGRAIRQADLLLAASMAAPGFARTEAVFDAPQGGRFRFRLRQEKGRPVVYFVRQQRIRGAHPGHRICFDELGEHFLRQTFNPAMLGENLARKLAAPPPTPFNQMGVTGQATSTVALDDLVEFLPPGAERGAELFFQAYIRVVTTLQILSPVKQTWEVPALVRLRLRVHTEVDPAAIRIDPDPVEGVGVEIKDEAVKRTDGGTELGLVRDALIGAVQGRIAETINGMLTSAEMKQGLRTVIADQVKKPMPAPPPEAQPTTLPIAWAGDLPADGMHFHSVVVRRGKRLRVDVRLKLPPHADDDRTEVSIAMCDAQGGMLPCHLYLAGAERGKATKDWHTWELYEALFSSDAKAEEFKVRVVTYGGPVRYQLRAR